MEENNVSCMKREHCQVFIVILSLAGLVQGKSVIIPPNDATEIIGETATLHCEMDLGENPVMAWDHNDKSIYSYYAGEEIYRMDDSQYSVTQDGRNFNLTINRIKYRDAGSYTCRTIVSHATANLIVLDTPVLLTNPPNYKGLEQVLFSCVAYFGGPSKKKLSPDHYPQLQMYLNGTRLEGEVTEQGPQHNIEYHMLRQDHHIKLKPYMDGMLVTCETTTSKPMRQMTASTKITVQLSHVNDTGQSEPDDNGRTEEPLQEGSRDIAQDSPALTRKEVILIAGICSVVVLASVAVLLLVFYVIKKHFNMKHQINGEGQDLSTKALMSKPKNDPDPVNKTIKLHMWEGLSG